MVPPGAQRELSGAKRELSGAQRESCLERRERARAVWSAERAIKSTGGAVTSGCLPRVVYDWGFVRAGKGRLVTTAATAGDLRLVFSSGGLVRACCLRLVGYALW